MQVGVGARPLEWQCPPVKWSLQPPATLQGAEPGVRPLEEAQEASTACGGWESEAREALVLTR